MSRFTALYERISTRSQKPGYGTALDTQKRALTEFAEQQGFIPYRHYTDDGYSGRNFQRPAFQAMLEDIRQGRIDTVIVYDVSRFGRNGPESNYYTGELFPRLKVRFLSLVDGVDTYLGWESEFLPFLHLLHDWYARESSRKQQAVNQARIAAGKRFNAFPPYGYRRDEHTEDLWVPDPETAPVVQRIFRMSLEGITMADIARQLTEEKVFSPGDRRARRTHPEVVPEGNWKRYEVEKILYNEEYTGTKLLYSTSPQPVRFPGDHEALVSPEDYRVIRQRSPRKTPLEERMELHPSCRLWAGMIRDADNIRPLRPRVGKTSYWGLDHPGRIKIQLTRMEEMLQERFLFLWQASFDASGFRRLSESIQKEQDSIDKQLRRIQRLEQTRKEALMRRNHYRPVMPDPHPPLVSRSEELRHRREKNGELLSRFREAAPSPPWEIDTMIPRYFTGVRVSLPEYPKPKHPVYTLELDLPFSPDGPDLSVTVQRDVTTYHLIFRPEPEAPDMVSFTAGLITSGALDDLTERNEP